MIEIMRIAGLVRIDERKFSGDGLPEHHPTGCADQCDAGRIDVGLMTRINVGTICGRYTRGIDYILKPDGQTVESGPLGPDASIARASAMARSPST